MKEFLGYSMIGGQHILQKYIADKMDRRCFEMQLRGIDPKKDSTYAEYTRNLQRMQRDWIK